MHLDDLALFLRVAHAQSLSEAARHLDQTPASVSARLKRIEEELGVRLVERTTRFLPLCNYFSPVGSYSLKSYSLDPFTTVERVTLCHAATPVAPYAGPCPPK